MNNAQLEFEIKKLHNQTMITINHPIPDFEVEVYHQDTIKKIKLSDYRGKWLILIFYPGDFTFICPTELEEAAQHYHDFKELNTEVLSISTDSVHTHKAWHDQSSAIKQVEFPMLADMGGVVSRAFGTYIEDGDDRGRSLRGSFIINPDGILKTIEIHDTSIGRSTKETMRKLQAAIFVSEHKGQVCPASWEPGKETLKPGLDLVGKI